ncbi:MAG: hypothetical protein EBY39_03220 [Flavobacteriia bacterium]|nr:hypothetical protein [Flavobacteriia bacterium]
MSQTKKIANLVMKYTGVDIYSKRKTQDIVDARALFEYIMREDYKVTYATLTDHYRKNGKKRKHDVMIYSVKKFEDEIRHRRKDLDQYYNEILNTEITVRQYQNAYQLISQLKNQKQMRKFRAYMTELLKEPTKV